MLDHTLRSSNMAMENGPLIDDFPGYKPPLIVDFPLPCWDVPSGYLYNLAKLFQMAGDIEFSH